MKLQYIALILGLLTATTARAQHPDSQPAGPVSPYKTAVYVQLLGSAGLGAVMYDTRFRQGADGGWGGAAGVGYIPALGGITDHALLSMPLEVNYLWGKDGKNFFDLGGGITILAGRDIEYVLPIPTINASYRYQPRKGTFFKIGYSTGLFLTIGIGATL